MRKLPKVVANTKVGKSVELKIWRNKKLITKKLTLGRLESSEEFKEKKTKIIKKKEEIIESLKIFVRDINDKDISSRNLNKKTTGVVITNIEKNSQLINLLEVSDIILEVQKTAIKKAIVIAKKMKGNMTGAVKKIEKINRGLSDHFQVKAALKKANESINEGKYHDYRNDESLTPKQKIGYSMREVRDKLTELDKIVKMNVRFKNEVGVDSTSYWKNTHNAMKKISERLVKLANKVGQLY